MNETGCDCALTHKYLADSRQREEEAKEEIARLKAEWTPKRGDDGALQWRRGFRAQAVGTSGIRVVEVEEASITRAEYDALRAENARLTLAASESARTLQVEIERLKETLASLGATLTPDGGLRVNMQKYHAAHRCEVHRATRYTEQDLDACMVCRGNQVTALQEALTKGGELLVEASYLMRHFKETDAAYRGWREKGQQWLAALPQDGA